MSLTQRQGKILNCLIREYINRAEPIGSELLKERYGFDVSPATIRNELQELADRGYVGQPHTSAGRIPTEKGYRYFIEITFSGKVEKFPEFILREVEKTRNKIEKELQLAKELSKELEQIHSILSIPHHIEEETIFDILKIVTPSRKSCEKNIGLMKELLEELEQL